MPPPRKITSRSNNSSSTIRQAPDDRVLPNFPTDVSPPRHAHIPVIPHDCDLGFYLLALIFSMCSTAMQYLHLYRTVWWLPHSHAKYAVNFYLIDLHLVGYLVAMETVPFLRVIYKRVCAIQSRGVTFLLASSILGLLAIIWTISFFFFSWHVYTKTSGSYLLLLVYPPITYTLVYYGHIPGNFIHHCRQRWQNLWPQSPLHVLHQSSTSNNTPPSNGVHSSTVPTQEGPNSPPLSRRINQSCTSTITPNGQLPIRHNCTSNPEEVRDETELLKADFNRRFRDVLFSTLFTFFYASLVPLMFVPSTVHYDAIWCGQHVAVTSVTSFLLYAVHHLPPAYVDLMHRCALHLGRWQKEEGRSAHVPYNAWSELQVFPQGALVKHVRGLFRAVGINNSAEPGNSMHSRFFYLFYPPLRLINFLCLTISLLLLYQFVLIINSHEWYKLVSVALMVFFNFATLYKILRNKILLGRCYKEESVSIISQTNSVNNSSHPHAD